MYELGMETFALITDYTKRLRQFSNFLYWFIPDLTEFLHSL